MSLEDLRARRGLAWDGLRAAIEEYFDVQALLGEAEHDIECEDPLCDAKERLAKWGPQSLSTFVLLGEYTTMDAQDPSITGTRTTMASHGSPMAVLGLITEQFVSWSS